MTWLSQKLVFFTSTNTKPAQSFRCVLYLSSLLLYHIFRLRLQFGECIEDWGPEQWILLNKPPQSENYIEKHIICQTHLEFDSLFLG